MLGVKNIDLEYIDGRTKRTIFSDVSFDIQSGEFVSLLGPSGSGKSSLLYIVSLLKTPTVGEIYLDDVLISRAKNKNEIRYENFGFVFQHHFLIPHLTVLENVCTASYEKNVEKQAKDLLERLGLKDLMNQKPYKLSGGERQRVAIARAVVKKPRILFADEPTTALDVTIQAQILDLLKELRDKMNTSIILITHDLGVIAKMCDRVLVMYGGKVAEKGTVDEIFYETAHPYTAGLIKSIATLDTSKNQKLVPIDGTPPDLFAPPKGCPFAARCEFAMKVCYEEQPEFHRLSDEHTCACWLQHEYAPKVDIMKGLTEAQKQEEEENVAALPEEKRRGHHGKTN